MIDSTKSPPLNQAYDCVVIGAGPAGCSAATLVAQQGFATLLVERERMPRFHVGESLMPETYWPLQRLGMLEKMQRAGFVEKRSVQFVSHTGKESQPFYFDEHDPRDCSRTWQVERAKFDQMLFENAREHGATCLDGVRVLGVEFDGDRAVGVQLQRPDDHQPTTVRCRVVIDGTGQQALMASRLGLRQENPQLKKAAVWGHFRNAWRDDGPNEGATVILHTYDKKAWFWYIPLSNNIVSVGLVSDRDQLFASQGSPHEIFSKYRAQCRPIDERLANAELVNQKLHINKEFSYTTTQQAGHGWVLVGDAFGFIDPIYSSGVYFALQSGMLAADCVSEGLRNDDVSPEQLGKWCAPFQDGVVWVRKLVDAFYTNSFSFGKFMKAHPEHQGNLTDILIGRIFHDQAGKIFEDMDAEIGNAETGM